MSSPDNKYWLPDAGVRFYFGDIFVCEPDWSWHSGLLPRSDLWYIVEGVGSITQSQQPASPVAIAAGDCVVMHPGYSYSVSHDSERPLYLIAVHFDLYDANRQLRETGMEKYNPFVQHMANGSLIRELLIRAVRTYQDGCHAWSHAWLQPVLMEILRQQQKNWPAGRFGDQARRIEHMCERIRNNPGKAVRVEALAAEMGISPEHFCRLFARLQGISPRKFITRTRIEAARRLLLTSRHSIQRIAELLGYDSPFQFARQFKAKIGVTPSGFRANPKGSLFTD